MDCQIIEISADLRSLDVLEMLKVFEMSWVVCGVRGFKLVVLVRNTFEVKEIRMIGGRKSMEVERFNENLSKEAGGTRDDEEVKRTTTETHTLHFAHMFVARPSVVWKSVLGRSFAHLVQH